MRYCAFLAAVLASTLALKAAQDKPKPKPILREIPTKGLKLLFPKKPGKPTEPTVITAADDLTKNEVAGKAADEVKKEVDFARENLLVFAWEGSGQDQVNVSILSTGGKHTLSFKYTPGKTRDLRQNIKLQVVPKELAGQPVILP
jgi:hypothetical protein